MAWKWVGKIINPFGQELKLVVPVGFDYTWSGSYSGVTTFSGGPYDSEVNRQRAIAMYTSISNSEIYPQFSGRDKVGFTYSFPALGGGLTVTEVRRDSNGIRNEVSANIKNMGGTTLVSWRQQATANDTTASGFTVLGAYTGFCAAYDTESEHMFFGFVNASHYTYQGDAYYRVDVYMEDYASNNVYNIFASYVPTPSPEPGDNPYGDDDYDEPTGGDGDHDETSDMIDEPALPVITASSSGFISAFVPNIGEINALANYLISPGFGTAIAQTVLGGFKDMIIGLQVFPCTIPSEEPDNLMVYLPGLAVSSGVQMGKASNQFVEIPCGSITVEEYWGNCCDYNPYTKIGIFLPFCGFYELDTDDVMGKTIEVKYRIDIMSGACLATIKVDGSVMYQYSGSCSAQIPISSSSYDEFMRSMIDLGVATATGGAGLAAAGASEMTAMERSLILSDRHSKLANATMDEAEAMYNQAVLNTKSSVANAAVNAVISGKGQFKHAGALGSSVGFLGVRKPYLIIKRPEQLIPSMYGAFHGYPCFTKARLSELAGYTVVDDIRLNIPDATVEEILECERLLKEGVVL